MNKEETGEIRFLILQHLAFIKNEISGSNKKSRLNSDHPRACNYTATQNRTSMRCFFCPIVKERSTAWQTKNKKWSKSRSVNAS